MEGGGATGDSKEEAPKTGKKRSRSQLSADATLPQAENTLGTGPTVALGVAAHPYALDGTLGPPTLIGTTVVPKKPKRFKTSYILFSGHRYQSVKADLESRGLSAKAASVSKEIATEWKALTNEEKSNFEALAQEDKQRYQRELDQYKQDCSKAKISRKIKDPSAPKRPMSAYLAFSNQRRQALKQEHPEATNGELSKMLSHKWKTLDSQEKTVYVEEEARLRAQYKADTTAWKRRQKLGARERANQPDPATQLQSNERFLLSQQPGQLQQPPGLTNPVAALLNTGTLQGMGMHSVQAQQQWLASLPFTTNTASLGTGAVHNAPFFLPPNPMFHAGQPHMQMQPTQANSASLAQQGQSAQQQQQQATLASSFASQNFLSGQPWLGTAGLDVGAMSVASPRLPGNDPNAGLLASLSQDFPTGPGSEEIITTEGMSFEAKTSPREDDEDA